MRCILSVLILLAAVAIGAGQMTAMADPSDAPSPTAAPGGPVAHPTPRTPGGHKFRLRMIPNKCVRPGDSVTLAGEDLNRLGDFRLVFKVDHRLVLAEILSRSDQRIILRIPKSQRLDRQFALFLANPHSLRKALKTNLTFRPCPAPVFITDQLESPQDILIFADLIRRQTILQELRSRNIAPLEDLSLQAIGSVLVRFSSSDPLRIVNELRVAMPWAALDVNSGLTPAGGPRLYAREKIDWPQDKACLTSARDLKIGLLDGAVDSSHDALRDQQIFSRFFVEKQIADFDHATAIASIFVGNSPPDRLQGLLAGASIFSAVILQEGTGRGPTGQLFRFVQGLDWLLSEQVHLINVSLASNSPNRVLAASVKKALFHGAIIFAAAGNQGPNAPPTYPAALDGVIAVTAIDVADRRYSLANTGDYIDLAAPGVDIWAAKIGGGGHYVSGTSYAVPFAVAVAALNQMHYGPMPPGHLMGKMKETSLGLTESPAKSGFDMDLVQGTCFQ